MRVFASLRRRFVVILLSNKRGLFIIYEFRNTTFVCIRKERGKNTFPLSSFVEIIRRRVFLLILNHVRFAFDSVSWNLTAKIESEFEHENRTE